MPKGKDYNVFKKIVLEAENNNEHGKVAEIVTSLYGTPKEQLQVKRINDKQKKEPINLNAFAQMDEEGNLTIPEDPTKKDPEDKNEENPKDNINLNKDLYH